MLRLPRLLSSGIAFGVLLAAAPAGAFCRSTTCSKDCPRDDDGCKIEGAKLFWSGVCVGFSLQRDGTVNLPMSEVRPAIEDAFAAWSDVDCGDGTASIAFAELADVSCRQADYDADSPNANVVLFQDTKWSYRGVDNTLAKTTVTYDTATGEIFDADIEINHAYNEFTVGDDNVVYDLRSVITHEVGHFVGIDHSAERAATMFAGYDKGTIELRTIDPDDMAALCEIYPPGRAGMCDTTPRNGLGDRCTDDPGPGSGESIGCALSLRGGGGWGGGPIVALAALGFLSRMSRRKLG